jgi:exodeoxyribonuclease V gamma subunit
VLSLSYSGLSPRDGCEAPPSVVVSELLDYLAENYTPAPSITRHRLQPFSPAYFRGDSPLFSYSADNARAATAGRTPRSAVAGFATEPLPEPGPEWHTVDLDQLAEFLAHPAKFFVQKRLRLARPDDFAPLEESEPLELDRLERYSLDQELTRLVLAGHAPAAHLEVVRASGILPHGYAGDSELDARACQAMKFAAQIRTFVTGAPLPPRTIDTAFGKWHLTGLLHDLYPTAHVRHRAASLKAKDLLHAWVRHLALQLSGAAPRETLLFASDAAWRFTPRDDAPALLADLLALYREGLRSPLPFFPTTSLAYATHTLDPTGRKRDDPVTAARKVWAGSSHRRGESEDPWFRLCFPADPLDTPWQHLATRLFAPLLATRQPPI